MKNFLIALGILTKLPLSKKITAEDTDLARSMTYFPVVGLLLGLLLVFINHLLTPLLPPGLLNLFLIIVLTVLTGAIHIDGLADTADGLCAKTKNKEEILKIMRDPCIGTMGAIAAFLLILSKYELLNNIPAHARDISLILMCSISRWIQVAVSRFSRYARTDGGLGRAFIGNIKSRGFYLATCFVIIICAVSGFPKSIFVLILAAGFGWIVMKYINKKIGGQTGDTIGAASELSEVFVLLTIFILERSAV